MTMEVVLWCGVAMIGKVHATGKPTLETSEESVSGCGGMVRKYGHL